jgi:hypothetical protein
VDRLVTGGFAGLGLEAVLEGHEPGGPVSAGDFCPAGHLYRSGYGKRPAMTGPARPCVAIACPYAQRVSGIFCRARRDALLSGLPGLPFRTIAVMAGPDPHARHGAANAVGLHGPPGFKSPILRSDQQFCPEMSVRAGC